MPEITLKQVSTESYEAHTPGGIVKFGDGSPGPMTTTAAALAGCLAMSVMETLEVMRQKVDHIELKTTFERKEEEPKIFKHFKIHITFRGENLSHAKIEKALHLSEEKTCPMSVMMRLVGAKVETTFTVVKLNPPTTMTPAME